jgi:hypothetical protein
MVSSLRPIHQVMAKARATAPPTGPPAPEITAALSAD